MAVIDINNFITHLIWNGLVDNATCGDLKKAIELCTVKGIYTKDDIITILTELYTEIDAMSDSVVEGRSITITSWTGMQKRIVKLIQSKIEQIKTTTKNDLAVSSELEDKENVSPIIDWNNCHTSEQLESISTTKNNLGVKFISKSDVDKIIDCPYFRQADKLIQIMNLPSVTFKDPCDTQVSPQEPRWVPVSERPPKIADVYLVTRYYKNNVMNPSYVVDACFFDGSNTWYNDNRINHERAYADNIIAWQENPEPYEPQERKQDKDE